MSPSAQAHQPEGHPEQWRRALTAAGPGLPWVTYYQPETAGRIELSRATFDNWVAKAAGMLADEYDVEAGSAVMLDLEPHWLLPVWAWATWALGATVVTPDAHLNHVDVGITDDIGARLPTDTVLMSSRHPLGLPASTAIPGGLPGGAVDALVDIRGYPDVRTDPAPEPAGPLVVDAQQSLGLAEALAEIARSRPVQRAAMLRSRPRDAAAVVRALLAPPFHGAALVIVDGGGPQDVVAIGEQELVDVDLG